MSGFVLALRRWFNRGPKDWVEKPAAGSDTLDHDPPQDRNSRIQAFVEELRAQSADWWARTRLINFNRIRNQLGPLWPKLQSKIELLAEKMISQDMSDQDRCLNLGEGEFMVYYADASASEIRLRCLSISEAIRQKIFGSGNQPVTSMETTAEHSSLSQGSQLPTPQARGDKRQMVGETSKDIFERVFACDPPICEEQSGIDPADIAGAAHGAIDFLVAEALQSQDLKELGRLQKRLDRLSLHLSRWRSEAAEGPASLEQDCQERLTKAAEDLVEISATLLPQTGLSHQQMLIALAQLRRQRAEREAENATKLTSAHRSSSIYNRADFAYTPVYRCCDDESKHLERIYQVLSRNASPEHAPSDDERAESDLQLLDHAIELFSRRDTQTEFILMVCVHAGTLRRPIWQRRYSTCLRAAPRQIQRQIMAEVVDYHDNENSIAVRRAIEELRAHFLAVFAVLPYPFRGDLHQTAGECRKIGLRGLGVDISRFSGTQDAGERIFGQLASACGQFSLASYVKGIESKAVIAQVQRHGVEYVTAPRLVPLLCAPSEHRNIDQLWAMA